MEHEFFQRLTALRDHEEANGLAMRDERLLDRMAASDQFFVLTEKAGRRRSRRWTRPRLAGRAPGLEWPAITEAARPRTVVGTGGRAIRSLKCRGIALRLLDVRLERRATCLADILRLHHGAVEVEIARLLGSRCRLDGC
jgi:hypothetical protein